MALRALRPDLLTQIFSSLGHGVMHLLAVYFYLVVLPLEREWQLSYAELIQLWTVGSFLVGAVAVPAGWLADRWSARGMMVIFFLGLGLSTILCGLANGPGMLWVGLCLLGSFAAIYHPVGIPWLVRNVRSRQGRAVGVNGVFGSLGVAGAGAVAGVLIDLAGWRAAFIVPGVICVAIGLLMFACLRAGLLPVEHREASDTVVEGSRGDRARVFLLLFVTMVTGSLIYQAMQAALPKVLALRTAAAAEEGALGVGLLVGLIYGVAALTSIASGHLADRYPPKIVYTLAYVAQVPILWLAATAGGAVFVAISTLVVVFNTGGLPAENLLLSRSASRGRQGVAFGIKFVMSFGVTPLAIALVSFVSARTGSFDAVFSVCAIAAAAGAVAASFLPSWGAAAEMPKGLAPQAQRL